MAPKMSTLFDFDYQFVKYGKYHNNRINRLIHFVFIPVIELTLLVWLTNIEGFSWPYDHILPANGAFILATVFGLYYITLWPFFGIIVFPIMMATTYLANIFRAQEDWPLHPNYVAGILHVSAWAFQIFGHFAFEGRAPAAAKDPLQAVVLAPLFVYVEIAFDLGFFKKTRLRLEPKIAAAIKELDKQKAKKKK